MKFEILYKHLCAESSDPKRDKENFFMQRIYKDINGGIEKISEMDGVEISGDVSASKLRKFVEELFDRNADDTEMFIFDVKYDGGECELVIWNDYQSITVQARDKGSNNSKHFSDIKLYDIIGLTKKEKIEDHMVDVLTRYIKAQEEKEV